MDPANFARLFLINWIVDFRGVLFSGGIHFVFNLFPSFCLNDKKSYLVSHFNLWVGILGWRSFYSVLYSYICIFYCVKSPKRGFEYFPRFWPFCGRGDISKPANFHIILNIWGIMGSLKYVIQQSKFFVSTHNSVKI